MKDIMIDTDRQKTEIITFLVCFAIATLLNVYAIISYDTPWSELYTSFFYLIAFSIVLYVAWTILRIVCFCILYCRNKKIYKKQNLEYPFNNTITP